MLSTFLGPHETPAAAACKQQAPLGVSEGGQGVCGGGEHPARTCACGTSRGPCELTRCSSSVGSCCRPAALKPGCACTSCSNCSRRGSRTSARRYTLWYWRPDKSSLYCTSSAAPWSPLLSAVRSRWSRAPLLLTGKVHVDSPSLAGAHTLHCQRWTLASGDRGVQRAAMHLPVRQEKLWLAVRQPFLFQVKARCSVSAGLQARQRALSTGPWTNTLANRPSECPPVHTWISIYWIASGVASGAWDVGSMVKPCHSRRHH